jgi:hypothetical protein
MKLQWMQKILELATENMILLSSPKVIGYYNQCLNAIGLESVDLEEFHVDGLGWSPEVASVYDDLGYLSGGGANPHAIIVSPRQEGLDVVYPHHSFDARLMSLVFQTARRQINDLTQDTGLWLEFDQDIDFYQTPMDLLMIDSFMVRIHTVSNIVEEARKQKTLIQELKTSDNWISQELRDKLSRSGARHGDLRTRSLVTTDIPFMDVNSFYTRVFGGVYVIRDYLNPGEQSLLVFDERPDYDGVYLSIKNTVSTLKELVSRGFFRLEVSRLEDDEFTDNLLDTILCLQLYRDPANKDMNVRDMTIAQKRAKLPGLIESMPHYHEIQRLAKKVKRKELIGEKEQIKAAEAMSDDAKNMLYVPSVDSEKDPNFHKLMMHLLVSLVTVPPEILYVYNRELFIKRYRNWSKQKKRWARAQIRKKLKINKS